MYILDTFNISVSIHTKLGYLIGDDKSTPHNRTRGDGEECGSESGRFCVDEYLCHRLRNGLTALSCAATDMCTVGGRDRPPGTQMSVGSGLHMDQFVYVRGIPD